MPGRVIVVGGDAAGMSAASQVRRANPDLEVVVFERGPYASYGACGIPYLISGQVAGADSLLALRADDFARRGLDVRLRHAVTAVRPGARLVEYVDSGGQPRSLRYDYLVLATGSEPVVPEWAAAPRRNVFALRGLPEAVALRELLDEPRVRRAAVVGGGFLGLEMAAALLERGLEVTLIERSQRLLGGLDAAFLQPVLAALESRGLRLLVGQQVRGLEEDGHAAAGVRLADQTIPAHVIVVATGARPAAALAAAAGVALGATGGIAVSDRMRTSAPGVFAAGDCVEVAHVVTGARVWSPLALTANRTGRIAGDNAAADSLGRLSPQRFRGTAGTMIAKVLDFAVARTGLTLDEARAAGFAAVEFARAGRTRAAYYPGGQSLHTRIVVDRQTQRLLGAQMLGVEGVAGRIDLFAAALCRRLTVQEVYDLDLAYAPPFGPVYDPVLEICGRAAVELGAL